MAACMSSGAKPIAARILASLVFRPRRILARRACSADKVITRKSWITLTPDPVAGGRLYISAIARNLSDPVEVAYA